MTTVSAQKRDKEVKAKKLRREGFVPGVICGKELNEGIMIQIAEKDALKLIREKKRGEQVQVDLAGEKMNTIIKDFAYNALAGKLEVLDFQILSKNEKIHATVEIELKNEEMAKGIVVQQLSEVHYKAVPENLLDTIVIDFEKLGDVKSMKVCDLEEFKNPEITVSNPEAVIFSLTHASAEVVDETEEEEPETK